jgi:aromatic-L-amino-acid decarboxylase
LRNQASDSGDVFDYRDWHVQLGRRFRSLKLWFVIRHYGLEGLQNLIRNHVQMAQQFASWIQSSGHFELITKPPLNLICFRLRGTDEENLALMHAINKEGEIYFTHTKLNGRIVLRLCIGQTNTEAKHVDHAWEIMRKNAEKILK